MRFVIPFVLLLLGVSCSDSVDLSKSPFPALKGCWVYADSSDYIDTNNRTTRFLDKRTLCFLSDTTLAYWSGKHEEQYIYKDSTFGFGFPLSISKATLSNGRVWGMNILKIRSLSDDILTLQELNCQHYTSKGDIILKFKKVND